MATALLTLKLFRRGNDVVAAGFLVFAIEEGVMLSGTATTLAGSVPSFAAGTALWSAALLLTSVPKEFAGWVRLVDIIQKPRIRRRQLLPSIALLTPYTTDRRRWLGRSAS